MFIVHHLFILRSSSNSHLDQQHQQIHTSVFQDQAQKPLKICSSSNLQDQAQKPLKICSSSNLQDQAQKPLNELPSTFKIAPRALKEISNSSSKIKLQRPLDQQNIDKSTPYGDRIR
ncbi:hypothetical protein ACFX15_026862 [Malus domestica]